MNCRQNHLQTSCPVNTRPGRSMTPTQLHWQQENRLTIVRQVILSLTARSCLLTHIKDPLELESNILEPLPKDNTGTSTLHENTSNILQTKSHEYHLCDGEGWLNFCKIGRSST